MTLIKWLLAHQIKDKYFQLILLCAAVAPLFWGIHQETFWSDELYSIYFSNNLVTAFSEEPHLPLIYVWNSVFGFLFGKLSVWQNLSTLIPVTIALLLLIRITNYYGGKLASISVISVFAVNPIFLHFSRSLRANGFMFVVPVLIVWAMTFLNKRRQPAIFLITLIGGCLFYVNVPVSIFCIFIYGLCSKDLDRQLLKVSGVAGIIVAMLALIKFYINGAWPGSFSLSPDLEGIKLFSRYFFTYADEAFSYDWSQTIWGLNPELYFRIYTSIMFLFLFITLGHSYFVRRDIWRIQKILIGSSVVYLLLVWLIAFLNVPVLTPRSHLMIFFLIQLCLGVGFSGITHRNWGRGLFIAFITLSFLHLKHLDFYTVHPMELDAIKFAAHNREDAVIVSCFYKEKHQFLGIPEVVFDCTKKNLESIIYKSKRIILVNEFFNPGASEALGLLRANMTLVQKKEFHYSKVYIFEEN